MRVIISVSNDIETDERVKRVVGVCIEAGIDVLVVGRLRANSKPDYLPDFNIKRFNLIFSRSFLFYIEFNIRLFFLLLREKYDLLYANDLDTALSNYIASFIRNKPLVIDSHEYFTGVPELNKRPFVKFIWKSIERFVYPRVKHHITVSYNIADLFKKEYSINPIVVRNIPSFQQKLIEGIYNIPFDRYIIYQGALNKDRGLEELIEGMLHIDNSVGLVIAGTGDLDNQLKTLVNDLGLNNRIYFTGRYTNANISAVTQQALLGFSLEKDSNINYKYCLPNKLFNYIQACIPVIVSNMPEMSSFVVENNIGIVVEKHNPKEIAKVVNTMLNNLEKYSELKKYVNIASQKYIWKNEKPKLIQIINDASS